MTHCLARRHRLLSLLPDDEWKVLEPLLNLTELRGGRQLLSGVFFPTSATLAVFDRSLMEAGAIYGGEAAIAGSTFSMAPLDAQLVVRHTGYAWTMLHHHYMEYGLQLVRLRSLIEGMDRTYTRRALATLRCAATHTLERRVARYLLEQGEAELDVTQQSVADALGIRRESVTEVFGMLDRHGAIAHVRGHVTVNLTALRPYSCGCVSFTRNPYTSV
jgi:hypothetical protein